MEKALRKHLPNGVFTDVSPARSKAMAAVRGHGNKTTERRLRSALAIAGVRGWKLRPSNVPGRPDFFFAATRLVVFVDGCFWHGCPDCGHLPRTNRPFWAAKIDRNRRRDADANQRLEHEGFTVIRLWEHELSADVQACVQRITRALTPRPASPPPTPRTPAPPAAEAAVPQAVPAPSRLPRVLG